MLSQGPKTKLIFRKEVPDSKISTYLPVRLSYFTFLGKASLATPELVHRFFLGARANTRRLPY